MEHQDHPMKDVKKTLRFAEENRLQVFCRLSSQLGNEPSCITGLSPNTIQIKAKDNVTTQFNFESVFEDSVTQEEIFENVGVPLAQRLFQNENGALLAYGATGSGKTFTIQGTQADPGLLPRILEAIVITIPEANMVCPPKKKPSAPPVRLKPVTELDLSHQYEVLVSYYEIYNELIYDLLAEQGERRVPLKLKADKNGSAVIANLTEQTVYDTRSAKRWLNFGLKNRNIRSTACNHDSSRQRLFLSHCVFEIKIVETNGTDKKPETTKITKLSVIDLAGTERASKTMASGERLREAININTSLTTLSRCIEALRTNQNLEPGQPPVLVPFRDSKLTLLLKDNFYGRTQGNTQNLVGKVSIMVNINPKISMVEETFHVLKFSSVAKTVAAQTAKAKPTTTTQVPFTLSKTVPKGRDTPTRLPPQSPLRSPLTKPQPQPNFDDECIIDPIQILKEVDLLQAALKEAQDRCETVELDLREEISQEVRMTIYELETQYEKLLHDQEQAFSGRLAELEDQTTDLTMELEDSNIRNEELVLKIEDLVEQNSHLTAQLDVMETISEPKASETISLQQHKNAVFNLELTIFSLQDQVAELSRKTEANTATETTTQLVTKSQIDKVEAQIALLKEMNETLKHQHEEKIREMTQNHKQQLTTQSEALLFENSELKETIQRLGSTVAQNQETIQKLCSAKVKEVKTRNTTKSNLVDEMQDMMSALLQEIGTLKSHQEKLQKEATEKDEALNQVKHELFKKRLELEVKEEEILTKERQFQKLKREMANFAAIPPEDSPSPKKRKAVSPPKQSKSKKAKLEMDNDKENARSPVNSPVKSKTALFLLSPKKTGPPGKKPRSVK